MNYLMFVIYGIIVAQIMFGKVTRKSSEEIRGYNYYRTRGLSNIIIGMSGQTLVTILLKGKGIISEWAVRVGLIGFVLIAILGFYYIYKMMTSSY